MNAKSFAMPAQTTQTIGRFEIIRTLGTGAQGSVSLAHDPHLQRQVAIKSIDANSSAEKIRRLLQEARVVSQFSHPNIVTLFDAIEHQGRLYLVLEYVEGMTLDQLLRSDGPMDKLRAVKIAIQIAHGLAYAHGKRVVHRDIKPANIIIDRDGTARIMDFGIASIAGQADPKDAILGTLHYMAPECLDTKPVGETADVLSLGMVLHEMLTGSPAVSGATAYEIAHKIANEPLPPPSRHNPEIDERLDHLVLTALFKNGAERYASAVEMKQALEEYLAPTTDIEPVPAGGKGTLDFLLRRMRHKSNFPALSQTISTINRIASDNDGSLQTLSAVLLKDFSLTNKLLRLVNSTTYSQFGGSISTISRAVMILGVDTVRNLAITLILFEHLQNKGQASQLKEDVIAAYFAGIMARRIAVLCSVPDSEEGFICGVFHQLGRLLGTYYFYDESAEIAKRVQQGDTEETASRAVLSITYEELGIGIAHSWNLPMKIIASMQHVSELKTIKPASPADRLKLVANLATALCRVASETPIACKTAELEQLSRKFGSSLGLREKQFTTVVEQSVCEFLADSGMFVSDASKSRVLKSTRQWSGATTETTATWDEVGSDAAGHVPTQATDTIDDFVAQAATNAAEMPVIDSADSAATLAAGIQDITNTLVEDYKLNDVLRIILETMYRGMRFSQVLLCTRDIKSNRLQARFGFGAKTELLLKHFSVELGRAEDVFEIALAKNVDLFIADSNADNIVNRIPAWYREKIDARTFLVLPIVIDKKIIGMFYADHDRVGELTIEPQQLRLLKTLRNQAVLAIRQKY